MNNIWKFTKYASGRHFMMMMSWKEKKKCSSQNWTRPYVPISLITPFWLRCYSQAKRGPPKEERTELSYGTESYENIFAGNIVEWVP